MQTERDKFLLSYLPLVESIARKVYNEKVGQYFSLTTDPALVELQDLVNTGFIGLIQAYNNFDSSRLNQFNTYAYKRIYGSIWDGLRDFDWLKVGRRDRAKNVSIAIDELEQLLGRRPTLIELADHLGLPLENVDESQNDRIASVCFSLEKMLLEPETDSPINNKELVRRLTDSRNRLTEQEQNIINFKYDQGMTYTDVGELLDISRSRVDQIHRKSLYKLRRYLIS